MSNIERIAADIPAGQVYSQQNLVTAQDNALTAAQAGFDLRYAPFADGLKPAAAQYETFPRNYSSVAAAGVTTLTSEKLYLTAIWLPAQTVVSNIAFVMGSTGSTTTSNWWYALYDNNRNQLAITADQTSASVTANVPVPKPIATTAVGAATSFTTTYTGMHYIGLLFNASGMPAPLAAPTTSTLLQLAPILCGSSDTLQTTPPGFPHQATALTAISDVFYGYV